MTMGYPRASPLRRWSDRLVGWGACAYGDPGEWSRRIGPEADAARVRAVRYGRSARWLLIAYVLGLVAVFGVQGFPSTGEALLPNVMLFASLLVVLGAEAALTIAEQSSRRTVVRIVNRAFGADPRRRPLVVGDSLTQLDDFDRWTAVHRQRWYDGTLPPIARRPARAAEPGRGL